ncbi:ATP-binding protein [Isoptericola sp. NPDC056578]|uniref:sensor histidine kinase n=1 Tax=Isoptericola sp. NPDC056578 TaxID=3345870 RepID=UPI0036926BB4
MAMSATQLAVQVVSWPAAGLVLWAGLRRRAGWVVVPTALLVLANAALALDPDGERATVGLAVAIVQSCYAVLMATYPDGRCAPRWLGAVVGVAIGLQATNLLSGMRLEEQPWWPWHYALTWPLLAWGQIVRYRTRSDARARQQVRWVLTAVSAMVVAFLVVALAIAGGLTTEEDTSTLATALLVLPGLGFSLGVVAPRSANLDRALRWVLAVGLTGLAAAGAVVVSTALTRGAAPPAPAWGGALAAVLVAVPGWRIASRWAELVVYGRRRDPLNAIDDLDELLAARHEIREVPETVVRTIASVTGAAHVSMDTDGTVRVESGAPTDAPPSEFVVVYRGEQLARVFVTPRPGEQTLTRADQAVIQRICAYAGPALDGARALEALVGSRSRTVLAREEERKRVRGYLHDDLAPTFSGLGLSAAALERYATDGDPRTVELAHRLAAELGAASRRLREVAYDMRPPELDARGLVQALRDRLVAADGYPTVRLDADVGPTLPAAVEAAAYRIVQEAVTNVRRHAGATVCDIRLRHGDSRFDIEVTDDGLGFPEDARDGVGLTSARERAAELGGSVRIMRAVGGGTVLRCWLPIDTSGPS